MESFVVNWYLRKLSTVERLKGGFWFEDEYLFDVFMDFRVAMIYTGPIAQPSFPRHDQLSEHKIVYSHDPSICLKMLVNGLDSIIKPGFTFQHCCKKGVVKHD